MISDVFIECIVSQSTSEEAFTSHIFWDFFTLGTFEVNYMDDVGQTLLNWASAFGTLEMVCSEF